MVDTIQDLEPYTLYVNPYFVITEFSNADKVSKHYYMPVPRGIADSGGTQRVASELAVQTTSYSPLVSNSGSSSSASSSTESFKTQTNTVSTLNQGLESALPQELSNPWLNNLNDALANFGEDQLTLEETQNDLPTIESIYPDLSPTTSYKTTTTTRVIYWYHPDYIGNVDLVSDNSGEAYEFFLYNPWGESLYEWNSGTASFSSPYRFNGKELDEETGLEYYGARYYDNQLSMWLSVDPMAHLRESLTPYNFVSNNPIMRSDPTGALDGDYYDSDGNHLGNDGIDDGKVYEVSGSSRFSINDFQEGGKYHNNQSAYNQNNGDGFSVNYVGDVTEVNMTFTGSANSSNPKQADGQLNIIQSVSNGKDYTRASFSAVGGPWGKGSPENGNYTVDNLYDRGPNSGWPNAGMTVDGVGFSLNLNPQFETGRSLLRLHPDGGKYFGTQGCIGLTCGKSGLLEFRGLMQSTLSNQANIPLNINILNNPNNNGYGSKVKSNGE